MAIEQVKPLFAELETSFDRIEEKFETDPAGIDYRFRDVFVTDAIKIISYLSAVDGIPAEKERAYLSELTGFAIDEDKMDLINDRYNFTDAEARTFFVLQPLKSFLLCLWGDKTFSEAGEESAMYDSLKDFYRKVGIDVITVDGEVSMDAANDLKSFLAALDVTAKSALEDPEFKIDPTLEETDRFDFLVAAEEAVIPEEPAVEIPVEEPAVEVPVEEVVAEEPVAEEPAAEIPVEEVVSEEPVAEVPVEEVAVEEPTVETPVEEAVAEEPAVEMPVEEAVAEEPAVEIPVEEPVAEEPTVEIPVEEVAVEEPAVEIPVEDIAVDVPEDIMAEIHVDEEPVLEEPAVEIPAEEAAPEEPAVEIPVEDLAAEISVEEPVAEEPAVDIPVEDLAAEMPAEEVIAEEPIAEIPVEEAIPEVPEDLMAEIHIDEEPVIEESVAEMPMEELAGEEPSDEIPLEDLDTEISLDEVALEEPAEEEPAEEEPIPDELLATEDWTEVEKLEDFVQEADDIDDTSTEISIPGAFSVEDVFANVSFVTAEVVERRHLEISIGENGSSYIAIMLSPEQIDELFDISASDNMPAMIIGNQVSIGFGDGVITRNLTTGDRSEKPSTPEIVSGINQSIIQTAQINLESSKTGKATTAALDHIFNLINDPGNCGRLNDILSSFGSRLSVQEDGMGHFAVVDQNHALHSIAEALLQIDREA